MTDDPSIEPDAPEASTKRKRNYPATRALPSVLCTGTKSDGSPCTRAPIQGGTVCMAHGGSSGKVRAAANRRLAEQRATAAMHRFGIPLQVDPVTALTQELHRSAGMVEWCSRQLGLVPASHSGLVAPVSIFSASVTDEELGDGPALMIRETTESGYRFVENPLLKVYRDERKHLAEVAKTCVSLGLRQIEVEAFVQAARAEVDRMGDLMAAYLSDPEMAPFADVAARVLRRHMTGAPEVGS